MSEDVVREVAELVIAGLGGSAARAVADLLVSRLAEQGFAEPVSWLREALKISKSSRLATLTDFSNNRNQYIKDVEDGQAAFLTRRGVVVAAVLPVAPGQYEEEIYAPAARRILAEKEAQPPIELTAEQVADIATRGLSPPMSTGSTRPAGRSGARIPSWAQKLIATLCLGDCEPASSSSEVAALQGV